MDLLAGVRKEGSRGGRADFSWSDVETSSHRENYLGHSLKAPVGRWQKNRDLSWYAKADGQTQLSAEEARKEEIRLIKEAEQDALSRALGFAVEPRGPPGGQEVVEEIKRVVGETASGGDEGGKGIGFGATGRTFGGKDGGREILGGTTREGANLGGLSAGKEKGRDRARDAKRRYRERRDRSRSPETHHSYRHRRERRSRSGSRDRHAHGGSHHYHGTRSSRGDRRSRSRDRREHNRRADRDLRKRPSRSPSPMDRVRRQNSRSRGYEDDTWRPQQRRSRSRNRSWSSGRLRLEDHNVDRRDRTRVERDQSDGGGWDRR